MKQPNRVRLLLLGLVLVVIAAVAVPMYGWLRGQRLSIAANSDLTITCPANLGVTVENNTVRIRCAEEIAMTQGQAAAPTTAPAAATTAPATGGTTGGTSGGTTGNSSPAEATASLPIYADALAGGWDNWSWGSTIDFNSSTAHAGSAISLAYTDGWSGLYLHSNSAVASGEYTALRFWANGGSAGGQKIRVCGDQQCNHASEELTIPANSWASFDIPLSTLNATSSVTELMWQNMTPGAQQAFFLDDIALVATSGTSSAPAGGSSEPAASGSGPALAVDASASQRAISPYIYGINFPDEALAAELQLPVQRWGGNATTRYNWQTDTANRASDWFFENIPYENANASALPNGSSSDQFIAQGQRTGTASIITIPMIGWTPKSREIACGFPVATYADQQQVDSYNPCGNGMTKDGAPITGNDPALTSTAIGPEYVTAWIEHLKAQFGAADAGGVPFYNLDNEPSLWHFTHRDVHPDGITYDELRDRTYEYAAAIKAADPAAQTLGPVEWGWTGYLYSGADQAAQNWNDPQDRNAHGGTPLVPWYLQQMQAYEKEHGVRILDFLDLHYYPQAQGVALQGEGDANTQALRLRSTRSLWDASYADESWIGESIHLIPRMREWVDQNYPGTKLALTEYNWGALDSINGALAQADILGIFGREGMDLATLWALPAANSPGAYAFRVYRNYDGEGAMFGETSVQATSADQEQLAVYAATREADGALTIVVVNKTASDLETTLSLANTSASTARVFHYMNNDLTRIQPADPIAVENNALATTFPAASITMLELK